MFLVSSWSCLCPIHWSHVLSPEWRCGWSRADRWCSNYIWVVNNFIAYSGASYIRGLVAMVLINPILRTPSAIAIPANHGLKLHPGTLSYPSAGQMDSYGMCIYPKQWGGGNQCNKLHINWPKYAHTTTFLSQSSAHPIRLYGMCTTLR